MRGFLKLIGVVNLTGSHCANAKVIGEFCHAGIFSINFKKDYSGISSNPEMGKSMPTI